MGLSRKIFHLLAKYLKKQSYFNKKFSSEMNKV